MFRRFPVDGGVTGGTDTAAVTATVAADAIRAEGEACPAASAMGAVVVSSFLPLLVILLMVLLLLPVPVRLAEGDGEEGNRASARSASARSAAACSSSASLVRVRGRGRIFEIRFGLNRSRTVGAANTTRGGGGTVV